MVSTVIDLAKWIKSPQLYQLSYRPKYSKRQGKHWVIRVTGGLSVPVVYPNRSPVSIAPIETEWDMGEFWRRTVCP